ncbi:hypothetical protein ACB098_01G261700 [Castanea mollissima]
MVSKKKYIYTIDDDCFIFSFVFGDGEPNQGIEEERWKLIGQYISSNGGVVTAEELAPYLHVESTGATTRTDSCNLEHHEV